MFAQLLTPIGDSLALSFLTAVLPVLTVLVLLGVFRRPAWQASLAGLDQGKLFVIPGWRYQWLVRLLRVLPAAWVRAGSIWYARRMKRDGGRKL